VRACARVCLILFPPPHSAARDAPTAPPKPALAKKFDPKTLFVKNLAFSVTEDDLRQLFSQHGKVNAVRMGLSPEGKPRGFAYVEVCHFAPSTSLAFTSPSPRLHPALLSLKRQQMLRVQSSPQTRLSSRSSDFSLGPTERPTATHLVP
jgi:hypothetical protein